MHTMACLGDRIGRSSTGEYGCCLGCAGNGNGACESLLSSRQVEELGKWVLQHSIDVRGRSQNY